MKNNFIRTAALVICFLVTFIAAAFSQTNYSDIDHLSGWSSCSSCAGVNGAGPVATYWMKQNVSSPSIDGRSTQLFLGGSKPYSNALFSRKLTTSGTTASKFHHFIYDVYFYYTNSTAVQALEFNTSQYFDGKGLIFGIQCDVRSSHVWELSTSNSSTSGLADMHWASTGVSCPAPPTYKWNHLVVEYERTSGNNVHYIAFTFNGVKRYLNKTSWRRKAPSDWGGVTTHLQLDGNYQQADYSVWMDKYKVTAW